MVTMPYDGYLTVSDDHEVPATESESYTWPTGFMDAPEYAEGEWSESLPITGIYRTLRTTRQTHRLSKAYVAARRDWHVVLTHEEKCSLWPWWSCTAPKSQKLRRRFARTMRPWADTGDVTLSNRGGATCPECAGEGHDVCYCPTPP